ncbi:MAG TPA: hypothetical protein EYF97_01095 [Gammaproteobacteria bacterium]|jgi:hypothetical protein|nr:hypothetical protein [Gammaproteobacteria bacterium]HIK71849.1 hypothetical protein [Gammaproteobacteria bacterium]
MNEIEVLVQKEKEASYNQSNKDLFTFYTLTLINQEESQGRLKNKLISFLLISMVPGLVVMLNVENITNFVLNLVLNLSLPLLYNTSYSFLVCIFISGFVLLFKRKSFF